MISQDDVREVMRSPSEKFDFSMFHPLDHQIWSARCSALYGGRPRHVSLWWDYQRPRPLQELKCKVGRHEWTDFWVGPPTGLEDTADGRVCTLCWIDGTDIIG